MSSRRLPLLLVAALALGGCRPDTVRIAYRPRPGTTITYRVTVHAVAVTTIGDQPPRRTVDDETFTATHAALEGGLVRVRLESTGGPVRTFVVRVDRAAQLAEVRSVEGVPASALGGLGLAEIFPAAAGAPPDRRLSPGDRWTLDQAVTVSGSSAARLTGSGRLTELGVVGGRKVATISSRYRLPVATTTTEEARPLRLDGVQSTVSTATRDIRDGLVETVHARTTGTYKLFLLPPAGGTGPSVPGALTVEVRSTTRRLR